MGHSIRAIISQGSVTGSFCNQWREARTIELPQNFKMVFITNSLFDEIHQHIHANEPAPFKAFFFLNSSLMQNLRELSFKGDICYFETDYFGGKGYQSAIVLRDAEVVYGPQTTYDKMENDQHTQSPEGTRAVNGALKLLGVTLANERDEWDMLKLHHYRRMDED